MSPKNKRPTYSPEVKANAIRMMIDEGKSVAEVARATKISDPTLSTWKKAEIERRVREDSKARSVVAETLDRPSAPIVDRARERELAAEVERLKAEVSRRDEVIVRLMLEKKG